MTRTAFRLALVCVLLGSLSLRADEGPNSEVPELKPLNHYVGEWDIAIQSEGLPFEKGKVKAQWILDGRFVEQVGELQERDGQTVFRVRSLMTYDSREKTYRVWTFASDGSSTELTGTWDTDARMLITKSPKNEDGGYTTVYADFSQPDVENWKMVYTGKEGNDVTVAKGKNTKR